MEVIIVNPHGYCQGVKDAIKLAIEAQEANKDKTCYLLGGIVHNEDTIRFFKDKGFIILDEKNASLEELIETIPEEQVVIYSAHGHPRNLEAIAEKKHLIAYDATCPFVTANMRMAEMAKDRDVIYVGAKNHAEATAFMANEKTAGFYDATGGRLEMFKEEIKEPLVIGQTTLSKKEFEDGFKAVRARFATAEAGLARCHSTTARQEALREAAKDGDCVIVLGSRTSNNSLKLFEIGLEECRDTYIVLGLNDLKRLELQNKKRIVLCSGASTSAKTFDECLDYLQNI